MRTPLLLDRSALAAFEICPRRFQLRYLTKLPWPASPLDRSQSQAVERGRQFHRLIERHFLGLPIQAADIADEVVRDWWRRFTQSALAIPAGDQWPEHRLTIPAGDNFLTGRFDLLVLGERDGEPFVQIFDWKTSRPRSTTNLEKEWQTRLYMALAAESGTVLSTGREPLSADRVSLTYWYAGEADQPREVNYSKAKHRENWSQIQALVTKIDAQDPDEIWPLTEDWRQCRTCSYQTYCGRQEAGTAAIILAEEEAPYTIEPAILLEPQTP